MSQNILIAIQEKLKYPPLQKMDANSRDTVKCWGVSEKMKDSPSFIYYFEEKYFSSAYYECYWTAKDIRRLMADSSFDVKAIFVKEGIPSK